MAGDKWVASDAYEAYMGRWSRPLARAFVEWLKPPPAGHWLEVGCGTGALTSGMCELAALASIVACDPSEPFIRHARETVNDIRASFVVAGADDLPTREGGFDGAVSGLALNLLPDPAQTLASIRERLRRSGVVAAYVWDYAKGMEFLRVFWDEAVAADPDAGPLDEAQRFPVCRPEALSLLFRTAGLRNVETGALDMPTAFASFEDYWTPFLGGTGPAPSYAASLDPPRRERLRERLRARLRADSAGQIQLRARAWAIRGVSN